MGERATGPYQHRGSWRVTTYLADGARVDRIWPTEAEALEFRDDFNATARGLVQTVEEALERYEEHLIAKGNKPRSYLETMRRLVVFFVEPAKPSRGRSVDADTTETSYAERGAVQGARARRGLEVLDGGRRGRGRHI